MGKRENIVREVRYQMQFNGRVTPDDEFGVHMAIEAQAEAPAGIAELFAEVGHEVVYRANVENESEGAFRIAGQLVFHRGTLNIEAEDTQALEPVPGEALHIASVSFRITGGTGALAGAKGRISSLFTVDENANFRDSQSGIIFLAESA